MVEIIQNGNPVLRKISKEVCISDIKTHKIQKLLKNMTEALYSQDDGIAIAAPQIGKSLRVFIVSGKIFDKDFLKGKGLPDKKYRDLVFINPVLKKLSKDKRLSDEGCLSVRPIFGKVLRADKAVVEAYNEKGEKFTRGASGLLAQIFQHEIEHLDGGLFIDTVENLYEILPKDEKQKLI
jgi:peptide deformylase